MGVPTIAGWFIIEDPIEIKWMSWGNPMLGPSQNLDLQTLLLPFLPSVFPIGLSTRNGESTENMDDP